MRQWFHNGSDRPLDRLPVAHGSWERPIRFVDGILDLEKTGSRGRQGSDLGCGRRRGDRRPDTRQSQIAPQHHFSGLP